MDTMDLTKIPASTIDFLLDEIEENEKQLNSVNQLDLWIRSLWKVSSFVEVYSTSSRSWFKGNIIDISYDNNDEFMEVKYVNNIQQIRTKQTERNDMSNIRPFSKAMPIYKYIFSAISVNCYLNIDINGPFSPENTPMISDLDELSSDDLNDNGNDSDTPEPTDTPQPPVDGYGCSININCHDASLELSDDTSSSPPYIKPPICGSRSCGYWELKTMTRLKRASSTIKCITPITQRVAVMKINSFYRRRSVATIDFAAHKLYKLDPDLLKIREEFEERLDGGYEFMDSEDSDELM